MLNDNIELKRSQEKKEMKEKIVETLPDYIPEGMVGVGEQFKVEKVIKNFLNESLING